MAAVGNRLQSVVSKYAKFHVNPDLFQVAATKPVPAHIERPLWLREALPKFSCYEGLMLLRSADEIASSSQSSEMKQACNIAARCLESLAKRVKVGMTAEDVDAMVHDFIVDEGAYPSGEGFMGFPKAICISPNDVLCHGVPNSRKIEAGDWINFDVTCYKDGFFGDTSITLLFGDVDPDVRRMVNQCDQVAVGQESLYNAVKACKPGNRLSDIAKAIE